MKQRLETCTYQKIHIIKLEIIICTIPYILDSSNLRESLQCHEIFFHEQQIV